MLGCDEIVCFGDGKNDISMFHASDAAYAVSNAENELKAIATDIIGSNEEDGVAKWLLKHANPSAENERKY
jgi:hydroxymethylpyrimidine pyrophosphatase-like HAD family hydrolase